MKCTYCGGEVSAQSEKCPYCGNDNPEGIAFQREVVNRIERNKFLRLFWSKKKKPEAIQKILTRILVIAVITNVLLTAVIFWMVVLEEDYEIVPVKREGFAGEVSREFLGNGEYFCEQFCIAMYEVIDKVEAGEMPDEYVVGDLVSNSYRVMSNMDTLDEQSGENMRVTINTFFEGYLGLTKEEMAFLEPGEDGTYSYLLDSEVQSETERVIKEKLGEVVR